MEKPLPAVPILIGKGTPELPVPPQSVFEAAHTSGPYRRLSNLYPPKPEPPLAGRKAECLAGVPADCMDGIDR